LTSRDVRMPLRGLVRPLPGVTVVKSVGIPEWLFMMNDGSQRNCLVSPDSVLDAVYDKLNDLVPEGGWNNGMGEFWELARDGD